MRDVATVAVIGGGPGGYEAALVARQLGADVTLIERDGVGGSAVLTDCVPSKTLVATAGVVAAATEARALGVLVDGREADGSRVSIDFPTLNTRIIELAEAQSVDIGDRLVREGVRVISGTARFAGEGCLEVIATDGTEGVITADTILIATGARPRTLADAEPDGERILTWEQLYRLPDLPTRLIVVGSGVTGAEFAGAYHALGSDVVLISSRDRVLPGEDPDAARVIEDVFRRRGIEVMGRSRAVAAARRGDGVVVTLDDGRTVEGSHVLMAVGSLPNTEDLGLGTVGVAMDDRGFIAVDRVSRTSARGIYAAGDCTGVLMLASVAAMQGRIAMWHALGDAVTPLDRARVSSTVFTTPEIATVGVTQGEIDTGDVQADSVLLPLATNPRAKMQEVRHGFVKVFCRPNSRLVIGGVIVGPHASELIHVLALAIEAGLNVDDIASTFTVYPSLSGSTAEAARRLHHPEND